MSGEQEVGIATGFFWRVGSGVFLVSNWHVLSGRNNTTSQPVQEKFGLIPDSLQVPLRLRKADGSVSSVPARIPLWRKGSTEGAAQSLWLAHPAEGQDVDVAAVALEWPLTRNQRKRIPCVNDMDAPPDLQPSIGDDVFVIGFPLRPELTNEFPVWKRGSVATELGMQFRNKDAFLVDSSTKDGMSGSPVIYRSAIYSGLNSALSVVSGGVVKFLGVYSGRQLGTNDSETQLGIVWQPRYVEEVCAGNSPGCDRVFGAPFLD